MEGSYVRIAGVSKREHLHNTAIRDMLGGMENVLQRIAGRRMKYFGHVEMLRTPVGFAARQRTTCYLLSRGLFLVGSWMGLKGTLSLFYVTTHANLLLGGRPEPERKYRTCNKNKSKR